MTSNKFKDYLTISIIIVIGIQCLFYFCMVLWSITNKPKELSTPPVKEIKQSINDSITTIKVKKDEEIKVVLGASNDSTIIIFKQLVNE